MTWRALLPPSLLPLREKVAAKRPDEGSHRANLPLQEAASDDRRATPHPSPLPQGERGQVAP